MFFNHRTPLAMSIFRKNLIHPRLRR